MPNIQNILYNDLLVFSKKILIKVGFDNYSSNCLSEALCMTSLRGVDSHGIRLLNFYISRALLKKKNIKPKFIFKKKFPAVSILDADRALGHVAGFKAMERGMKDANKYGISLVVVKNSTHPGALASIAIPVAKKGFAALAFTNSDSLMLSHLGKQKLLGTNPICFVAPSDENEPFCLDMATTAYTFNKLLMFKKMGLNLPNNFAADKDGNMTNDPNTAFSLFSSGGYKGFGLSIMVEILTAVLANMSLDFEIPAMHSNSKKIRKITQTYIVFRVDSVTSKNLFIKNLKKLSKKVRSDKKGNSNAVMPNDPENKIMKKRLKKGIPLNEETYEDLTNLSKKYKIKLKVF